MLYMYQYIVVVVNCIHDVMGWNLYVKFLSVYDSQFDTRPTITWHSVTQGRKILKIEYLNKKMSNIQETNKNLAAKTK